MRGTNILDIAAIAFFYIMQNRPQEANEFMKRVERLVRLQGWRIHFCAFTSGRIGIAGIRS